MAQHTEQSPGKPAFHTGASSSPGCLTSTSALARAPGTAAGSVPALGPCNHMRDPDEDGFWYSPALAIVAIFGSEPANEKALPL